MAKVLGARLKSGWKTGGDAKGHGPSYLLTHAEKGKTVTNMIPAGPAAQRTRQHLDEYHPFRQRVQQLIPVSERFAICVCATLLLRP